MLPVGSDGRRLGRGTSRGTRRSEIPVQSALWVPSGVLSVQVMPSVQESGPLVMRRWVMSHTTCVSAVSSSLRLPRWPRRTCDVRSSQAFYVSPVSACPIASRAQIRAQIRFPACRFVHAGCLFAVGTCDRRWGSGRLLERRTTDPFRRCQVSSATWLTCVERGRGACAVVREWP
jgi:hypothetical protein